jgi:large subunit ribosomal protein L23
MNARQVILRPIVSEKSYALIAQNKYTFRVHPNAHKTQIRQAVEEIFDVTVADVRTMKMKPKPKRRGWTSGTTRAWKKAVIELVPGDRIELFEGAAIEQE